jgi:hypothetical protein
MAFCACCIAAAMFVVGIYFISVMTVDAKILCLGNQQVFGPRLMRIVADGAASYRERSVLQPCRLERMALKAQLFLAKDQSI